MAMESFRRKRRRREHVSLFVRGLCVLHLPAAATISTRIQAIDQALPDLFPWTYFGGAAFRFGHPLLDLGGPSGFDVGIRLTFQ
jgi:hypothetical protein